MKSQDVGLLNTVINAITTLANQGKTVNVTITQITAIFPDGRPVVFNQDTETPETDWYITAS